jgi:heat shock protein HtpX
MEKKLLVEDHIRRNKRQTIIICSFMAILFIAVVLSLGYILFAGNIVIALIFAIPIAVGYVLITYSISVQAVLSAAKARPANPKIREEKLFMYKVEEMSIAAGLPMPKVYVQEADNINAFATGKKPEEAVICVTTGALRKLKSDELEGVMAHEMSHIKNNDILIMTVTVAVVGAIALISELVFWSLFWGGARGRKGEGNAIIIILAIIFV